MRSEAQAAAQRRYNASPKGRASRRRYAATEKGRAVQLKSKQRWNAANPDKIRDAGRRRHGDLLDRVNAIKLARGCADCGYAEHPSALDFDHAGSDKVGNVSSMLRGASWARLEAEIAKCEVVCANCHRIRTFNEWQARR